jgi:hypothetical protein
LVGVNKTELNIGLEETVGELIGEKQDSSELLCTEITLVYKMIVHGVSLINNQQSLSLMDRNNKLKMFRLLKCDLRKDLNLLLNYLNIESFFLK